MKQQARFLVTVYKSGHPQFEQGKAYDPADPEVRVSVAKGEATLEDVPEPAADPVAAEASIESSPAAGEALATEASSAETDSRPAGKKKPK